MAPFKPNDLLAVLDEYDVRYVLIGGLAAILHGGPHVTSDVDIVPQESTENLDRLSKALDAIDARIRIAGDVQGVPFSHDADSLRQVRIWNLVTDLGELDIMFVPSGTRGYDDLARDVEEIPVEGIVVPVASLADVVRSKEAAGRPRDRSALPALRHLLELRQRPS